MKPPSCEAVLSKDSSPRATSVRRIATSSSVCQLRLSDMPGTRPAEKPPERPWPAPRLTPSASEKPTPWARPAL